MDPFITKPDHSRSSKSISYLANPETQPESNISEFTGETKHCGSIENSRNSKLVQVLLASCQLGINALELEATLNLWTTMDSNPNFESWVQWSQTT